MNIFSTLTPRQSCMYNRGVPVRTVVARMTYRETIDAYNRRVAEFAAKYEAVAAEAVHAPIIDLLPEAPAVILDVGAGTGRDAAWLAALGFDVVAVEPARGMLEFARRTHTAPNIRWIEDSLPALQKTFCLGLSFDLILLNAVWMHVPPADRTRAFRKLVSLLRPGGRMILSLREGAAEGSVPAFPASAGEIETLARQHGLGVTRTVRTPDRLSRTDVAWETICLQLPDDGTEALPLLRNITLNDSKSSTYKLALLRVLLKIADGAAGLCRMDEDGYVTVPLGLVALYWLRMYKPLVAAGIPQMPPNSSGKGLGFVRKPFRQIHKLSHYDLRVGSRFGVDDAEWLHKALRDCGDVIKNMPAFYITYPNSSEQVFKIDRAASAHRKGMSTAALTLDAEYLYSFGVLRAPLHIWTALSRFACWIEPAIVSEWARLVQSYSATAGRHLTSDEAMQSLVWLEPERDTALVRTIAVKLLDSERKLFCVWSGKKLDATNMDIDHCFPFSAWPCSDFWNLLPTHRTVNQRQKGDKLVTAGMLHRRAEVIHDWWQKAYTSSEPQRERFIDEARSSLFIDSTELQADILGAVFEGLCIKRTALKRNMQLADWQLD